jgi:hypothetical protein
VSAPVKLKPGERSPAEKAFDFLMFPIAFYLILFIAAIFASIADSDDEAIGRPAAWNRALTVWGILCFIHWVVGARKVCQAWDDPFGRVLRFASIGILAMQTLAIAASFLAS